MALPKLNLMPCCPAALACEALPELTLPEFALPELALPALVLMPCCPVVRPCRMWSCCSALLLLCHARPSQSWR